MLTSKPWQLHSPSGVPLSILYFCWATLHLAHDVFFRCLVALWVFEVYESSTAADITVTRPSYDVSGPWSATPFLRTQQTRRSSLA